MKTSSKKPIKLDDLDGVELTASQAFLALGLFLEEFAKRFKPDAALATLLTDVQIGKDLMSNDPAALSDWAECVEAVVRGKERRVEADARPSTPAERNVILALLSEEFPGRDALLDQVTSLTVRSIDREGSLELRASASARPRPQQLQAVRAL